MSGALVIVGADPTRISDRLGVEPDRAWCAGERKYFVLPDGSRKELSSYYEQSGWKKFSPEGVDDPMDVVRYWAKFVNDRKQAFAELSSDESVCVEVLCQDNQLIEVHAADMAILSASRVRLVITVQVIA